MIGLLLPLVLARAFDMPVLVWVGLGAFLLAIGDCMDDGDRLQPMRLIVGALLGSLALATGVLAGSSLMSAILGMLFWGIPAGLLGVYGNAFASMGLPIAWAYVELGLPNTTHALSDALFMGALFATGGGLTLLLTISLRIGGPYMPLRAKTAAVYRALASYLTTSANGGVVSRKHRCAPPSQRRAASLWRRAIICRAQASFCSGSLFLSRSPIGFSHYWARSRRKGASPRRKRRRRSQL